jgi:hypothetical protein
MATVDDIDAKSAVRKFLERRSVVSKEDQTADSSDETTAVLESVALSFLLYPQAALSFVLQAKNVLQQVVTTDIQLVSYFMKALDDIDNPDEPITDTSDLASAQAALVEVDRIGRVSSDVQAYGRYIKSVNAFLDQKLATSLKRRNKNEFERTGNEAKQDLFRVLSAFSPTHNLMIEKLDRLLSSVDDFRSVSLTKIVSTRTVSRVRSSLSQVISGIQKQQLSKTAIAIELLSGAAALSSVSNSRDIYDPTIDTGSFPVNRVISISSERVPASARGDATETDLSAVPTPWNFVSAITVGDGSESTAYSVTLPFSGASGRCYVKSSSGSTTFNIQSGHNVLYVQFDGITPPATEAAMVRAVSLPTGPSVSIGSILSALNNGSTGLIDGTAAQLGTTGRILIYGSSSVTKIVIKNGDRGTFDLVTGVYTPATGTVHNILGFLDEQTSGDPNTFSPSDLVDLLSPYMPIASFDVGDDGVPTIGTVSTELLATISFSGKVSSAFGFSGSHIPDPSYLELIENDVPIDPSSVGVFVGSMVSSSDIQSLSARNLFSPVATIDGIKLRFDSSIDLPRCAGTHVRVEAPIVFATQTLFDAVRPLQGNFEQDSRDLQRVLSPILSRPTLAQVNDARSVLQDVLGRLTDLSDRLSSVVVRSDRSEFDSVAKQVSASLEERGLDKALELLQGGQFSGFFALSSDGASKGTRFLKATEEVGRNEFAKPPAEQDQNDPRPLGTTPDSNLLPGEELMEDEEQL